MTVDQPLLPATTLPARAMPPIFVTRKDLDRAPRHRGAADDRDGEDPVSMTGETPHWPRIFPGL